MKTEEKLITGQGAAQLPCPFCGHPITRSAAAVLGGEGLGCSSCGAGLEVDRERSAAALADLERHCAQAGVVPQASGSKADAPAEQTASKPAGRRGRPRRSRRSRP